MRRGSIHVTIVAALAAIGVVAPRAARADDARAPRTATAPDTRAGGDAMRIYIDPQTGRPVVPPAGAQVAPVESVRRAAPPPPAELPNPGPAGGFMMNTHGLTFGFTATVDASGTRVIECAPDGAAPAGR